MSAAEAEKYNVPNWIKLAIDYECPICHTKYIKGKCPSCGEDVMLIYWRDPQKTICDKCIRGLNYKTHCGLCGQDGCEQCMSWDMSCNVCNAGHIESFDPRGWKIFKSIEKPKVMTNEKG